MYKIYKKFRRLFWKKEILDRVCKYFFNKSDLISWILQISLLQIYIAILNNMWGIWFGKHYLLLFVQNSESCFEENYCWIGFGKILFTFRESFPKSHAGLELTNISDKNSGEYLQKMGYWILQIFLLKILRAAWRIIWWGRWLLMLEFRTDYHYYAGPPCNHYCGRDDDYLGGLMMVII